MFTLLVELLNPIHNRPMSELSNHQQSQPGTPTRRPETSQAANPVSRTPENAENALSRAKQRARESAAAAAAATAELAAEKARNKQLEERVRALELEKAQLKAEKKNGGGKIEDVYHVKGSSDHQIATKTCKGWVQFWQEETGLPLPKYCPCQGNDDNPGVPHKLHQHTAGAHVIFRTADGQLKVGIVPVCRGCNTPPGKPIVFECLACTIFDVGAQTYVGGIIGKSKDDQGEHATGLNEFDKLKVSLEDENLSLTVAGTGPKYRGKTPRTKISKDVSQKQDDLYYAYVALAAMGGLTKNHQQLRRLQHRDVAKVYLLNKGRGNTLLHEAQALQNGGDYRGAAKLYRTRIKFDPNNTTAHNNLGYVLQEKQQPDYDAAEKHYRKAIYLDPSYPEAYNNLGYLLQHVREDFDGAEQHYRKAMELNPKYAIACWNLSVLLENQKNDIQAGNPANDGEQRLEELRKLSAEVESPAPAKAAEPENGDGGHPETEE